MINSRWFLNWYFMSTQVLKYLKCFGWMTIFLYLIVELKMPEHIVILISTEVSNLHILSWLYTTQ